MNTGVRIAAVGLVCASVFTAGVVGGAHDYIASVSGATSGASLFSGLLSPDSEQLAFGGYTTPSPSPSPSPQSSGPGGDGCGGCGGGTNNGTNGSGGGGSTSGGGGMPSENSGSNSGDSFGGGSSGAGQGGGFGSNGGGGTSGGTGGCGGNCNGGGSGSSFGTGGSNPPTPPGSHESRDHQDTPASNAAEKEAQQSREAAAYARDLGDYKNPNAQSRTPQRIAEKIGATFSALEQAMSNLMGGTAAPVDHSMPGPYGTNPPAYQGTGLGADDFRAPPSSVPGSQTPTGPTPEDLRQALRFGPGTEDTTPHYVTSAATLEAMKTLKAIDTQQMTQAAAFQKKLANKIDTADSIVSVSEIDKAVGAECLGHCTDAQRIAIANVIMNRIAVKVTSKNNREVDIHDVLDAIDSNMQRRHTLDNKVYATADVGSPAYAAGAAALNAVLSGNLPADMPAAVRNATNYYNPDTSNPSWAQNNTLGTAYGDHKFLSVDGSTPSQVQVARERFEAGQINASVSFYKGMYDSASPQAARVQSEVTRSLTVAGRNIHIVTQSDGLNTQGPSHFQTPSVAGKSDTLPTAGAATPVSSQETSLDDPKNSNLPAPADVKHFLVDRGMDPNAVLNGQFAYRIARAISTAETVTGKKQTNLINSSYRSPEEQAGLYATYIKSDYVFKGVTYHPNPANLGHLAAAPPGGLIMVGPNKGTVAPGSRHQFGAATDLNPGPIRYFIRANAGQFGLETLGFKPDGSVRDEPHLQLGSATYQDPSIGKNAAPLDTKIGASSAVRPQTPQVTATPAAPAAGGSWFPNLPSVADLQRKAVDLKTSLTPSVATQKKLEFVSKLPPWAQNIVFSLFTGKGGSAPTPNTESQGGGSAFFPESQRATTTVSSIRRSRVDVTQLPWWRQYQAKLDALHQSEEQQNI